MLENCFFIVCIFVKLALGKYKLISLLESMEINTYMSLIQNNKRTHNYCIYEPKLIKVKFVSNA